MPGRKKSLPQTQPKNSLQAFMELGVKPTTDGGLYVSAEALRQIRARRVREQATPRTPATPRHIYRENGIAVKKGNARWGELQLDSLRQIREMSPITQVIHQVRHYQVSRMARPYNGRPGDVGWRVRHRLHRDERHPAPMQIRQLIATAERILEKPSPRYCPTLGQALTMLEEDYLTINRPVIEPLRWDVDPSVIVGWRPVDGALIWPTLHYLEKWWAENPGWQGRHNLATLTEDQALELLAEKLGYDVTCAEYCLVREGSLEAVYKPGDLIVAPRLNRTDIRYAGWPKSHVEQAAELILGFIATYQYNSNYFTKGMMAEFIIAVSGNVHDDDIDAFVHMLRNATQGYDKAWQPPVMPLPEAGVLEKIDLKQSNREMMFEVWLSALWSLCCGIYRMDPSSTNGKPWDGGQSPKLTEGSRHDEIALAKEEGLQGDLEHLTKAILDPMIQRLDPNLFVEWEYGDIDPKKEAETTEIQLRTTKTINQCRLRDGDEPLGFYLPPEKYKTASDEDKQKHDDNPYNWVQSSVVAQAKQQEAMREQMQQQQGDQDYGSPPDGDGQQAPYGQPPQPGGQPGGQPGPPGQPQQPSGQQDPPDASVQGLNKARPSVIVIRVEADPYA